MSVVERVRRDVGDDVERRDEVPDPDPLAAEFALRGVPFSVPLGDHDDDLRDFVIEDIDGLCLFFGANLRA